MRQVLFYIGKTIETRLFKYLLQFYIAEKMIRLDSKSIIAKYKKIPIS